MNRVTRFPALILTFVLALSFLCGGAAEAPGQTGLEYFTVRNGSRESRKIAITMDDINEREWVWKSADLCEKYGITMTFLPLGVNMKPEDRKNWQRVLDLGCELGNHTTWHNDIGGMTANNIRYEVLTCQQMIDEALGYHYEVRWFRPPYGNLADASGSMGTSVGILKRMGYEHALLWDVSWVSNPQTFVVDPEGTLRRTKNGSILLFHAREADYQNLEQLIPMLLEAGYEPVTVSALFGMDPPETGGEVFVYDPRTYQYPDLKEKQAEK